MFAGGVLAEHVVTHWWRCVMCSHRTTASNSVALNLGVTLSDFTLFIQTDLHHVSYLSSPRSIELVCFQSEAELRVCESRVWCLWCRTSASNKSLSIRNDMLPLLYVFSNILHLGFVFRADVVKCQSQSKPKQRQLVWFLKDISSKWLLQSYMIDEELMRVLMKL